MTDQPVFRKELEQYMDAYLPILYVDTLENGKVQDILPELAGQKGRGASLSVASERSTRHRTAG